MDAYLELAELFGRLSTAANMLAVCTLLKRYAIAFGVPQLSIMDLRQPTTRISEAMLWTDTPQSLLKLIDRAGDFTCHAMVKRARETQEPFEIAMGPGYDASRSIPNPAIASELAERAPATNGLVVPIYDGQKAVAIATLTGPKPQLNPLAANALNLAIHAAWQRSKELTSELPSASTTALTLREVECLGWVAKGKTDIEIARIINVAPRTVRFHVHNAKVKLNVATRIQAVTKLMRERPDLRESNNEN